MQQVVVIIVGAGPSGIATSACLNRINIPNVILEREDCYASLWKKKAYDRLKLHLAKQFCELPYMSFPTTAPKFVPKDEFVRYIDEYVSRFEVNPRYNRFVKSAFYDARSGLWRILARNASLDLEEEYASTYLVVASGENSEGLIPKLEGLDEFEGEYLHSSDYVNGKKYLGKEVLVVGCGNSGMEISYDLSNWGVSTSIVVRGEVHVLSTGIVFIGMYLLKYLAPNYVDSIVVLLSKLKNGNISKYGFKRPKKGPFRMKAQTGRTPTIDVGAIKNIKKGKIKVYSSIAKIDGKSVSFSNGESSEFDEIIFATGFKSSVKHWLKVEENLFDDDGMPRKNVESKWKGEKGLYSVGFSRSGLFGISNDAKNVAQDIEFLLCN